MQISDLKPIHVFAEIERVDEDARTVEAYAFVNEVVEGEGGIRLKRSAMEEATGDYLRWANVRRMHQADAVGIAHSVEWDARGARMVLEVVDDDAWTKVRRGVYKGLSVGVQATLMRGKDVEKCRWIETSLVDRPKDPGAVILAVRLDSAEELEAGEPEEMGLRGLMGLMGQMGSMDEVARVEVLESRLAEVSSQLSRAEARIRELEAMPARGPVAKYGTGVPVERSFLANGTDSGAALREELQRLSATGVEMTYAQRQAAAARISAIRRELAALGG